MKDCNAINLPIATQGGGAKSLLSKEFCRRIRTPNTT